MRNLLNLLILLTVGVIITSQVYQIYFNSLGDTGLSKILRKIFPRFSCSKPVVYRIGDIDSRFKMTDREFLEKVNSAAEIWNKAAGKPVFSQANGEYDLTVNLVYDKRQTLDNEVSGLENELEAGKNALNDQIKLYDSLVSDFQAHAREFNRAVAFWNSQGGAPKDVYNELIQKEAELQTNVDKINSLAAKLNKSSVAYNSQVGTLRKTLNEFNAAINLRPEEGIYDPSNRSINLYFVNNENELIHTIAHEFGHSLGLGHTAGIDDIMFPYTTEAKNISENDLNALQIICGK